MLTWWITLFRDLNSWELYIMSILYCVTMSFYNGGSNFLQFPTCFLYIILHPQLEYSTCNFLCFLSTSLMLSTHVGPLPPCHNNMMQIKDQVLSDNIKRNPSNFHSEVLTGDLFVLNITHINNWLCYLYTQKTILQSVFDTSRHWFFLMFTAR